MLVELPAGSSGNLVKAFQDQYGSSIPPKELPAQSYFEVLEGMVQDRVFYAESLAQVVALSTLKTNIGSRTRRHIHSTLRCCLMGPLFVQSGVSSPRCQMCLADDENSAHQVVQYLSG